MDLFVANDTVQNFLFVNRGPAPNGHWKWEEIALQAGVGFSESGQARSGMGVDAADLERRRLAGSVRRQRRSRNVSPSTKTTRTRHFTMLRRRKTVWPAPPDC